MGELHELLAVENDLKNKFQTLVQETLTTFNKRTDHFVGHNKKVRALNESRQMEMDAFEENKPVDTTVQEKLDYLMGTVIEFWDAKAQKELTNQFAKADVVLDGFELRDVPATLLLAMESQLQYLRNMVYFNIPTLAPGVEWVKDETLGRGIYKTADTEKRTKTEKTIQHKVLVQATDKHPAQVEKWNADVPVAIVETQKFSGMMTPAEKSKMLSKIDKLIVEFKKARQRANKEEIKHIDLGKKIFDYINS